MSLSIFKLLFPTNSFLTHLEYFLLQQGETILNIKTFEIFSYVDLLNHLFKMLASCLY